MLNTIHFFRIKLCRLYLEIYSEFSFAAQNDTGSHFSSLLRQKRQNPTSLTKNWHSAFSLFSFARKRPCRRGYRLKALFCNLSLISSGRGGAVVSALSALILHKFFVCFAYGYSTCEWSLLYIRAALRKTRGESHSPPRWRILTSEVKVDGILAYFKWINRSIAQKKLRFHLPQTEILFILNRTSVWSKYRLYWIRYY